MMHTTLTMRLCPRVSGRSSSTLVNTGGLLLPVDVPLEDAAPDSAAILKMIYWCFGVVM